MVEETLAFGIQGIGFVYIAIFVCVVGWFVFWILGRLKNRHDWDGYRVDIFKCWWQGRGFFTANFAVEDNFDEETLDMLEEQEGLRSIKGIIQQYKKQKKLYIYNLVTTETDELEVEFHDKVRLVTTVPIESNDYSSRGHKEKRLWSNPLDKESFRHIGFVKTTWMKTIIDEDGHEVDYIFAFPIPEEDDAQIYPALRNIFPDTPVVYFQTVIEQGLKNIPQLNEFMKTFRKAVTFNNAIADERDMYKDLYKDSLDKIEEINIEKNELEEETSQQKYIDTGREMLKKRDTIGSIWIALSGIFAILGAVSFPSIFSTLDNEVAVMIGGGVGMSTALLGFAYTMSKVKPEERSTNMEAIS